MSPSPCHKNSKTQPLVQRYGLFYPTFALPSMQPAPTNSPSSRISNVGDTTHGLLLMGGGIQSPVPFRIES
jgi:hypothetical protein